MYTIGILRSVLIKNKQYKKLLEPLFATHIIPEFGNKNCGFLRSKVNEHFIYFNQYRLAG
jgi:hypothetical protein